MELPRELEDVIDLADRHGVELATVTGEIDLSSPTGRLVARMLGAAARHEAEHKAERQKRQRRQSAVRSRRAARPRSPQTRERTMKPIDLLSRLSVRYWGTPWFPRPLTVLIAQHRTLVVMPHPCRYTTGRAPSLIGR
jgi:hypothetical protein